MKILVCGSRGHRLKIMQMQALRDKLLTHEVIEGCCPNSPDKDAELICERDGIVIHHFPSYAGNYLKRNVKMCELADECIAYWNGLSHGTSHTIATMVSMRKPVTVIRVDKN